ncbi:MAG: hypothetical protein GYB68_15270 [Chloroflexi bacterium]|nr:hypothetical protein [Chloroflexota bacterium]
MPITLEWTGAEGRVLLLKYSDPVTWEQFDHAMDDGNNMLAQAPFDAVAIHDWRGVESRFFRRGMRDVLNKALASPMNAVLTISLGGDPTINRLVKTSLRLVRGRFQVCETLDEAYSLAEDTLAGLEHA